MQIISPGPAAREIAGRHAPALRARRGLEPVQLAGLRRCEIKVHNVEWD
jgi:hypothetical protein